MRASTRGFGGRCRLVLIGLGLYAITTFDLITKIVGVGGLIAAIVFFRPQGYAMARATAV